MKKERSQFSSKIGFVMAAAGSAVGLGNIWRFPYLAAKYGGGMFLLIYIIFVLTLGFTIMTAELAIGRHTTLGPTKAYGALNKKWNFVGVIGAIVAFIIFPYYCVIGGWIVKYAWIFVTSAGQAASSDSFFTNFAAQPIQPVLLQILFVVLTAVIVIAGVQKGIEKVSKIMMPILIILSIIISVYSCIQPGALEGVKYFLLPEWKNFSFQGCLAAMGQMFYSLSLAMGIMITYGSYLNKKESLEASVTQIEFFDTAIALLAGFMIIPSVFVFSKGDPAALGKGVGLMFVNLPKVFDSMQFGQLVGALFFIMVFFAALTSTISLMEAVIASVCDSFNWSRKKAVLIISGVSILLGIPSALSFGVLSDFTIFGMDFFTFCDFITNSVMMPIGAFLTCIFVGHIIDTNIILDEVRGQNKTFRREKIFVFLLKYIAPFCILAILISSILEGLGIITF
ncbi:MAG: sodium-dependent transporter [Eubacteriaceae bacterium]|nr:sodium-dependent transporter [Eubacteriaceae bacterium]MDD4507712.1 sodium-dependent transporter [Eubacteriaceae bacterium]